MWQLEQFKYSIRNKDRFKALKALLGNERMGCVLDLGSGNGTFSYLFSNQCSCLIAMDLSYANANMTRTLLKSNCCLQADGMDLPFKNEFFDCVFLTEVLYYIPDERQIFSEIHRVLKNNGVCILSTTHAGRGAFLNYWRKLFKADVVSKSRKPEGYSVEEIEKLVDGLFRMENIRPFSYFFTDLFQTVLNYVGHRRSIWSNTSPSAEQAVQSKAYTLYKILYPIVFLFCALDNLFRLFGQNGSNIAIKLNKIA